MRRAFTVSVLAALTVAAGISHAAQSAFDSAADVAYSDGWQPGDNGGFGFGPWTLSGHSLLGSSTANGDAQPPTGDIDSFGGSAWALIGDSGGSSTAVRPLAGALLPGQHVIFDADIYESVPNIDGAGISVGGRFGIFTSAASLLFTTDDKTFGSMPRSREGYHIDFTLTGVDTYTATIAVLGSNTPVLLGGRLGGIAGADIDQITFRATNLSAAPPIDTYYFNNLAVTPEPGGWSV